MIRRLISVSVLVVVLLSLAPVGPSASESLRKRPRSQKKLDQRSWLAGLQSYASFGNWLLGKLPDRGKREGEMSVGPPVTAYLNPAPFFLDAPTNLTVTSTSDTQVVLSWTAPAGAVDHYQVERSQSISGPFVFRANATGTSFPDGATTDQAYLYRVRAVTAGGAVSLPSNMALGTATSFEFSSLAGQLIKAQHFYDVRTAINAVRVVANLPVATWSPRQTLGGLLVQANDVQEMRNKLDEALTALSITVTSYQDATLNTGATGTLIQAIHIQQLQTRSTRGSSNSSGPLDSDTATTRLDPMNATGGGGENPLSRNFNWNLPLVSLPGRAGLDLGLTLSYNSLVWTRTGTNSITFDKDIGFPAPGFRLGFPVIEPSYFNAEVGKDAFLLIGSDGSRTELRKVDGSTTLFEAADSSHLLFDSSSLILHTTDGTQLTYDPQGGEYKCTEIKDRNGNYISVSYTQAGDINTITDTVGRVITFEYTNGLLTAIKQTWNQIPTNPPVHYWARFEYDTTTPIDFNFGSMTVAGALDNSNITTLSKVTLADDSHFEFSYTSWGQVQKISNVADTHLLNYRSYNLPQTADPQVPYDDCPRYTVRREWAKYWNGDTDGTPETNEEALTQFAVPTSDTWTMPDSTQQSGMRTQVTAPDETSNKLYFIGSGGTASGWQRGLPALVNTYDSGGALQRQAVTKWQQDDETKPYIINPRVEETNLYDPAGNRKRTDIQYQSYTLGDGMTCKLPQDVREYAANASTILRTTRTIYIDDSPYLTRRIIGLPKESLLYEGVVNASNLKSKREFIYDESGSIAGNDAPVQHDNTNYSSTFVTGRGNLSSVKRYNIDNLTLFTTTTNKYNTAGAIVSLKDASTHETIISYADSFSDLSTQPNTRAYPTVVTDPDGFQTTLRYDFDFGAMTSRQTPKPNETTYIAGPVQTFTFDAIGRLKQTTNSVTAAVTRFEYDPGQILVDIYATIEAGKGEARSFQITDGVGRVIATATSHPNSTGGYSGQKIVYDVMGRVIKTSNPTETDAEGAPSEWDTVGDDESAGWIYMQQTYDWKGRPLVTTNQDGTTKTASYAGCGCAGGQVVTLTDEGTIDSGEAKKRQQKVYSDVLGRTIKTENLNWQGGTVFSTIVNTFNVRDQVTQTTKFAGAEGSATSQSTTLNYDGFGRLQSQHLPQQDDGTQTTYAYNADDTILSITDARGATTTYGYNGRHLTTNVSYSAGGGIAVPAAVTYGYDAAGNRSSMDENGQRRVTYHYDQLSRMDWEERQFPGVTGEYRLSYTYNLAGQVKSITDPTNSAITYEYDKVGRVTDVTGTPYGTGGINGTPFIEISEYATDLNYRAWGGLESLTYGNQMTLSQQFNQRLQLTQFLVDDMATPSPAPPNWEPRLISSDFQYYADGRLRSASDNLGDVFDRAYSYDHTGMAKEAYSGSEALDFLNGTSSGTPTGPYKQTYQFDAFGNMTSLVNRFWSQNNTVTSTFVNNRKQGTGISYDANGNLTQDADHQFTYDAAGRSASIFNAATNKTITPIYDGDGQVVNRTETEGSTTTVNLFRLSSTVLNGKVITELNSQGQKQKGYVYLDGQLIARQEHLWIVWQHNNPFSATQAISNRDGLGNIQVEPDPMGVDMGQGDPFVFPETYQVPPEGTPGLLLGPSVPSGRCTLDGIAFPCGEAAHLLAIGAAEFEVPTAVWSDDAWRFVKYNYDSGQYEVFAGFDYTSVTIDGQTSGAWHPIFVPVDGGSAVQSLLGMLPLNLGTGVIPQKDKKTVIDKKTLEDALKDCIPDLYSMFEFVSLTITTPNADGAIRIKDKHTGREADIVSDSTPPPDILKSMSERKSRGRTYGNNPWWTYAIAAINEPELRPGEKRYPDLYLAKGMDWFRTQIHEAGAALTAIRNRYYPGRYPARLPDDGLDPSHPDDGPSLEDCVGKKVYAKLGLTAAK